MRIVAVAIAWILCASIVCASAAWGQAPAVKRVEGTLVSIVPQQGIVVRTADRQEVKVALSAQSRIRVYAEIPLKDLPDEVPCFLNGGSWKTASKDIQAASISVIGANRNETGESYINSSGGGTVFFEHTLGKFRKGPPMTFQVGPAVYRISGPPGSGGPLTAPLDQQNALLGRVFPVASTGGQLRVRVEFGSDLSQAGLEAKVDVRFGGGPDQRDSTQVDIERVEPIKPAGPPKKGT